MPTYQELDNIRNHAEAKLLIALQKHAQLDGKENKLKRRKVRASITKLYKSLHTLSQKLKLMNRIDKLK